MRILRSVLRLLPAVALLAGAAARAQVPAVTPAPLVSEAEIGALGSVELMASLQSAQQALELGFATAAREEFRRLLARPNLPAEVHRRAALGLVWAELAGGRLDEAEKALNEGAMLTAPGARLQRTLIALLRKDTAAAAPLVDGLRAEDFPPEEACWFFVAQGMLAEARGCALQDQKNAAEARTAFENAKEAYAQAEARAPSTLLRVQMVLGRERTRLLFGQATPDQVRVLQQQIDQFPGRPVGLTAAGQQAVVLDLLGRKAEAQTVLQRQLRLVPAAEDQLGDPLRLLLALIAGADSGVGQNALRTLLAGSGDAELQRVALQLLAGAADNAAKRSALQRDLDPLIDAQPPSHLLDDLLLYRARLALDRHDQQGYERAEADARRLLTEFPGSPLRVPALNLLVAVAWELQRFRTATEAITRLQGELGPDPRRAVLSVLLAEAYFGAKDFRNAAAAYARALQEPTTPAGVARGTLMFQQVLALLLADAPEQLDEAQALLDRLAGDPGFDPVNRWRAEWNLVKTLEVRGQVAPAYARLDRILSDAAAAAAPPELHLRLAWLRARLSLEVGDATATVRLVDALLAGEAAAAGVPAALRQEAAGTALLLRAQALLELKREGEGLAELERLRRDYPGSDPAVYSFITQAKFLSERGQTVDAQQLLTQLAEQHKDSPYAPYALYEAAANAERRGQDEHYKEAYRILEDLVAKFPRNELVFYAKLRQGDLLRKVDDLGAAQVLYESLLNQYAGHRDAPLAELALADTLFAQVSTDASKVGSALARYERLFDLPSAPADVRIEAGFKEGNALALRSGNAEARRALWLVVARFLLDEKMRAQAGDRGRYWLGRTLLTYAELSEQAKAPEEARNAYDLVLRCGVWGEKSARAGLARLGGG